MKTSLLTRFTCSTALAAVLCGTGSTVAADYPTTVLGLNPIAYYRLNETGPQVPADLATNLGTLGAAANGFYLGTVGMPDNNYTHGADGALAGSSDKAVNFTGAGSGIGGISIPYSPGLNPSTPFSVEAWLQPAAQVGDFRAYFCALDASSSGTAGAGRSGWLLYQIADSWQFRLGDQNGYIATAQGGANVIGEWSHIVGIYDGANAVLYVNGAEVARTAIARPFHANPGETTDIGYSSAFARNISGAVDECAIYTNVLSPAEILAHYQNGTNASPSIPYQQLILAQHPVGYWRLNEPAPVLPDPSTYPKAINSGSRGSAANGTYDPGTVLGLPGVPFAGFGANSRAVKFNGVLSDIQIPPLTGLITNQFTFACWILSQATGQGNPGWPGYPGLLRQSNPDLTGPLWSSPFGLDIWYDGRNQLHTMWGEGPTNFVHSGVEGDAADYGFVSGLFADVLVWNFVAAVWTPSNTVVYLNGQSTNIFGAGPHDPRDFGQGPLFLGRDTTWHPPDPTTWGFNGLMAEPALFDHALTPAQVQSIYNAALATPQAIALTQTPLSPNFEGQTIILTVSAIGPGTLTYQWRKNSQPLLNQTNTTLSLANVTTADSGNYDVVISNANGPGTSSTVALNVVAVPPQIFQQPQDAVRYIGSPASFSVLAGGSTPISYQWSLNNNPISGATASSYTVPSVAAANLGNYSVRLTNPLGTSNSVNAVLTSVPLPIGYGAAVLAAHPAAYWRFNETNGSTAFDYAGGHDGTYPSALTNGVPGPQGGTFLGLEANNTSYAFEGSRAIVRTQPGIPLNGNTLTTIALATRGETLPDYACILTMRQIGNVAYLSARNDGRLVYDFNDDPLSYGFDPGFVIPQGGWAFVAETVAANQAVLYIDDGGGAGLQIATNVLAAPSLPLDVPIALGGDANLNLGQDRTWRGGLDEIAYYTRTLSPTEIAAIHQALVTVPTPTPGLISFIKGVGKITLSWDGQFKLQKADKPTGPFADVPGASSPTEVSTVGSPEAYYRLSN